MRSILGLSIGLLLAAVPAACQTAANGADTDIGLPILNGTAAVSGGTVTVNGSGADIWSNGVPPTVEPVQGNYFRWTITGDGSLTARVLSLTGTNQYAKAAVMFSDNPGEGTSHIVMSYVIPSGQASFFNTNYTTTSTNAPYFPFQFPVWLRLSRTGDLYTGSASEDGVNWTTIVSGEPSHTTQVVVGLAVTSHDVTKLATGVFDSISFTGNVTPIPDFTMSADPQSQTVAPGSPATFNISTSPVNGFVSLASVSVFSEPGDWSFSEAPEGVSITPPGTVPISVTTPATAPSGSYLVTVAAASPGGDGRQEAGHTQTVTISISGTQSNPGVGSQQDIASPPQPGNATLSNGVLTMNASGYISDNPDRLHYYYWQLSGDGSITARLTSLSGATSASKAGLMLRAGTDPVSPYAMASAPVLGGGQVGFQLQERDLEGGAPIIDPYSFHNLPLWMRLIRTSGIITILWSFDGVNWQQDTNSITYQFQNMPSSMLIGIAADTDAVFDNITVTGNVTP